MTNGIRTRYSRQKESRTHRQRDSMSNRLDYSVRQVDFEEFKAEHVQDMACLNGNDPTDPMTLL